METNMNVEVILGIAVAAVAILAGILGGYQAMVAPLRAQMSIMVAPIKTQITNIETGMVQLEARARLELDKAERGLKELTMRAETVVRQTVQDVDDKLKREASLIDEKSKIQFQDMQRQIELLRAIQFADMQKQMDLLRTEVQELRIAKPNHIISRV